MADLTDYPVDEFVKGKLKSCHVTPKGLITGYVVSKQEYDILMRDLRGLGYRFSVRSTYSGKSDAESLQFKVESSDLQIPFTGPPFHVENTTYFQCTHGFRYFKSKISLDDDNHGTPKKKQRKVNESIKLGCPAKMTVKSIRVYPDYECKSDTWRRKSAMLKKLKADMKGNTPPKVEFHFWIAVSPESAHNHERDNSLRGQLHPDLVAQIHGMVRKGVTHVPIIRAHLERCVEEMFKNSGVHPQPLNASFYPNDKAIYNHVYEAKSSYPQPNRAEVKVESQAAPKEPVPTSVSLPTPAVTPPTGREAIIPVASSSSSLPAIASAPRQDHQMDMKCTADLAVVPVLDTLPSDWQNHEVLPTTNIVQVLNNGTLMFMVTQPLSDHDGRVGDQDIQTTANLVNVNLNDNIFTVITDPLEQRVLQINNDSNLLMAQSCSDADHIDDVLKIGDNVSVASDKNIDLGLDRVMSLESGVIVGVSNSQNQVCMDEDVDGDNVSCHDDTNQFLFVGDDCQDSQSDLLMKENNDREMTELCVLPPTQSSKEPEPSLFSSTLSGDDPDKSLDEPCRLTITKDALGNSKHINREGSEVHVGSFHKEDSIQSLQKAIRENAQDIINISYSSTNSALLWEIVEVFEKCRERLEEDLGLKERGTVNVDMPSLSMSTKTRWKESQQSFDCIVTDKVRKKRRTILSSDDSSVDSYEDLVIND